MAFAHLHVHTEYSLLDGASRVKELIRRTKELGMDSVAITLSSAVRSIWHRARDRNVRRWTEPDTII